MKRQRGRGGRKANGSANRHYESNGPEIKIRGSASHIHEKYQQLARDATSSGDHVKAENYLQHAEHYYRLVQANQAQQQQNQQNQQNRPQRDRQDGDEAQASPAANGHDGSAEAGKDKSPLEVVHLDGGGEQPLVPDLSEQPAAANDAAPKADGVDASEDKPARKPRRARRSRKPSDEDTAQARDALEAVTVAPVDAAVETPEPAGQPS